MVLHGYPNINAVFQTSMKI